MSLAVVCGIAEGINKILMTYNLMILEDIDKNKESLYFSLQFGILILSLSASKLLNGSELKMLKQYIINLK